MLITAIALATIGFILLVLSLASGSTVWSWVMIGVVLAGIIVFGVDVWNKRRRGR